jgi:DNA polymerase III sliding clamp (beta) subunit (PCNA family)
MFLRDILIELIDYKTIGVKVTAESVKIGVRYRVNVLTEGRGALLTHLESTKALITSTVINISIEEDILIFQTNNTIYTFKTLEKEPYEYNSRERS